MAPLKRGVTLLTARDGQAQAGEVDVVGPDSVAFEHHLEAGFIDGLEGDREVGQAAAGAEALVASFVGSLLGEEPVDLGAGVGPGDLLLRGEGQGGSPGPARVGGVWALVSGGSDAERKEAVLR